MRHFKNWSRDYGTPAAAVTETFWRIFAYLCMIDIFISIDIMILSLKQIEKISKALGDANRLKILQHISKKGGCGQCAEIQGIVDLTQPSISHHIKILLEAGLIEAEKEGRNHKYNLNEQLIRDYTAAVGMIKS